MMKITIKTEPKTKKNSQRIIENPKTKKPMIIQSPQYLQYERDASWFMPVRREPIQRPVNVKAVFYMKTRRIVDLVNLQEALLDILVKNGVLADDNSRIVHSMDGSYVDYDKENPRTEVEIWEI